ncbi:MAG: hypothetical protein QGH58_07750 [Arenicellales bacterium]|nr:hypothetical protein [Arenicellales bacterium]
MNTEKAVMELCDDIEGVFNPIWLLDSSNGDSPMDTYEISQTIEKLAHTPEYEENKKKYDALSEELNKELLGNKYNQVGGLDQPGVFVPHTMLVHPVQAA